MVGCSGSVHFKPISIRDDAAEVVAVAARAAAWWRRRYLVRSGRDLAAPEEIHRREVRWSTAAYARRASRPSRRCSARPRSPSQRRTPSDDGYLRVEQQADFQRRYHDDAPPAPNANEARAREHDMSRWRDDVDESHYLWIAAANGDDYAMLHHLRAGADVGFREKGGPDGLETTPLHIASQRGHLACVRVLIEHGAGVTSPTSGATRRPSRRRPTATSTPCGCCSTRAPTCGCATTTARTRRRRAQGRCVECARLLDGRPAALPGEDLGPPLETALLEVLERAGLGDLSRRSAARACSPSTISRGSPGCR